MGFRIILIKNWLEELRGAFFNCTLMGKGNGKGKDDSTVIGKALLISSGFGIFLCFVGIIVTFASVTYTPPTEAYTKCAKALQFSCDKTDCSTASGDTPAVTPGGGSGSGSGSGTGGGTTGTGTGSGTGSGSSTGVIFPIFPNLNIGEMRLSSFFVIVTFRSHY